MIKLMIEMCLTGAHNNMPTLTGIVFLDRHGILMSMYWSALFDDCEVTTSDIDDESCRFEIVNPRIRTHRNISDEGILDILEGAVVLDAGPSAVMESVAEAEDVLTFDSVMISDENRTIVIEPGVRTSFWWCAKNEFMRSRKHREFDFFDSVNRAKEAYYHNGSQPGGDELVTILRICRFRQRLDWGYTSRNFDKGVVSKKTIGEQKEHSGELEQHLKEDASASLAFMRNDDLEF